MSWVPAFHGGIKKAVRNTDGHLFMWRPQPDLNAPAAHKPVLSRLKSGMSWTATLHGGIKKAVRKLTAICSFGVPNRI
jgi:hypothetical protein